MSSGFLWLDRDRVLDGDINVIVLDIDPGVSPDRCKDMLLCHSVSWGGAIWHRGSGDVGSIWANVSDDRAGTRWVSVRELQRHRRRQAKGSPHVQ